jgi:hypothetical protein
MKTAGRTVQTNTSSEVKLDSGILVRSEVTWLGPIERTERWTPCIALHACVPVHRPIMCAARHNVLRDPNLCTAAILLDGRAAALVSVHSRLQLLLSTKGPSLSRLVNKGGAFLVCPKQSTTRG